MVCNNSSRLELLAVGRHPLSSANLFEMLSLIPAATINLQKLKFPVRVLIYF